jgi:hypothetical protein
VYSPSPESLTVLGFIVYISNENAINHTYSGKNFANRGINLVFRDYLSEKIFNLNP